MSHESVEPEHVRVADEIQADIYRAMSPQDRLLQALRMNRSMRELLTAGLRERHPDWTESQIRHAVVEHILYARTG
ncbi:MAG: hypothetical protein KBA71_11390 [Opitutaceae bacterium]|nr:hypothetical protein [Opitutaceae bacterium]